MVHSLDSSGPFLAPPPLRPYTRISGGVFVSFPTQNGQFFASAATTDPVAPNRPQLILAVLAAGLAAGILVVFAAQHLRPAFGNVQALSSITGLPVLGIVGSVLTDQQRAAQSRDTRWLVAACAVLLGTTGLLLVAQDGAVEAVRTILLIGRQS